MPRELARHRERLAGVARELQAVSPLAVLGRGYAILEDEQGRVVRRADDTAPGDRLAARLGDGHLTLEVLPAATPNRRSGNNRIDRFRYIVIPSRDI